MMPIAAILTSTFANVTAGCARFASGVTGAIAKAPKAIEYLGHGTIYTNFITGHMQSSKDSKLDGPGGSD